MIQEHDHVMLTIDLPDHQLISGDVGTIVHIYKDNAAYEVEFFTIDGKTLDVVTLERNQVRALTSRDVWHARASGTKGNAMLALRAGAFAYTGTTSVSLTIYDFHVIQWQN